MTTQAPSGHSHYTWQPAGAPVAVHLNFDVIDRMIPDVMRGFTALRRRGAEVGGVLLGRVEGGVVTVEDFAPVPCEYASGPSYHLSSNDRAALERVLTEKDAAVVGFYRSHTRADFAIDDHDIALHDEYFPHPQAVVLVVKPSTARSATAGFFLWEGGSVRRETRHEFPFSRRDLGGGESKMVAAAQAERAPTPRPAPEAPYGGHKFTFGPPAPAEPARAVEADRVLEFPVPSFAGGGGASQEAGENGTLDRAEISRRRSWLLIPVLLAVCTLGGVAGLWWSKMGPPAGGPLGMAVRETGQQLDVTWDQRTPAVRDARAGVLTIRDGVVERTIDMTPEQLRDGRVRYSRVTGDVALRLEVESAAGEKTSESLRVVSGEVAPAVLKKPEPARAEPPKVEAPKAEAPKPTALTDEDPMAARRATKRGRKAAAKKTEEVVEVPPEPADPTTTLRPGRRK